MRSQTFTITAANINSGTLQQLDVTITQDDGDFLSPRELQIINDTGANVEFTILANEEEIDAFNAGSTEFAFLYLPTNFSINNTQLPRTIRVLVRRVSGSATKNLRIDLSLYSKR